ncbi:hypothetical protein AGMMS49992_01030 [Clostridia bacterium]|nr:hypothetical protein AGMMS49992_01030 [Clostridia bacterium]
MSITIRRMERTDLPGVTRIWNASVNAREVVYAPMDHARYESIFLSNPNYDPAFSLVAEKDSAIVGFINGITKKVFLPKEHDGNTPGYITCIFVDKSVRGQGLGTALLNALLDAFRRAGKTSAVCSGGNPINLDWIVPGTPGHDHNNAPGVDEDCAGHGFLLYSGFADAYREVAMYLNLAEYRAPDNLDELQIKLRGDGIETGRYDPALGYDYDGMCDRVGSEYWRKVLRDECAADHPRPILAATHEGRIVGFTGPVDKQPSGRGWFTGICTDPLYERRGIATVLFNLLMQEFIAEGAAFSTLFTGDDNHAQRLYARTGFRVARRFVIMKRELE